MNTRSKTIVRTLLICLSASVLASLMKIFYGRSSHSLAFVADGIHSLFDSAATIIGIVSIGLSAKPPDEGHPYGHHKFETVSALALGLLLFLAAYEVGTMAYQRILFPAMLPQFSIMGLVILGVTMAINLSVARMEAKKAKELSSSFLAADSLHNQSDFLITCAVLATVVSAHFGIPYADAGVSLGITVYLVYLAIRLILYNLQPLVDHSVLDPKRVEAVVSAVPGVVHCHHIRSRGEEGHYFLDLNLHLPGKITLDEAHTISHEVEERLKKEFPGLVDVVIHTEPDGHAPCPLVAEAPKPTEDSSR